MFENFYQKNIIERPKIIFTILILSIYSAYFTLINRTFTTLYNQKEGISDFSKRVFKVSLAFFVLVTGTMLVTFMFSP